MKRRYREAMRAQLRLQDSYVDGVSDDEAALEARNWHDEYAPDCTGSVIDSHLDETIPF